MDSANYFFFSQHKRMITLELGKHLTNMHLVSLWLLGENTTSVVHGTKEVGAPISEEQKPKNFTWDLC